MSRGLRPPGTSHAVGLAGPVDQPAVHHQRGRAAAVEVDRLARAERGHQLRELGQGEARLVVARGPRWRRPAAACRRSRSPPAGGGPPVMSESNCERPAEKPSRSSPGRTRERPSDTRAGPACSRSPTGARREGRQRARSPSGRRPRAGTPGRGRNARRKGACRRAGPRPTPRPSAGPAGRDEEPAHQRVAHARARAPCMQGLRSRERDHRRRDQRARVDGHVDRRRGAATEVQATPLDIASGRSGEGHAVCHRPTPPTIRVVRPRGGTLVTASAHGVAAG